MSDSNRKRKKLSEKNESQKSTTVIQEKVLGIIENDLIKKHFHLEPELWISLEPVEKVNMMTHLSKQEKRGFNHPIYKCLSKKNYDLLTNTFKNTFKPDINKTIMIWEIIAMFYGEETPLQRRKKEKKNIRRGGNVLEGIKQIYMSEIFIPIDITRQILSFLQRNYNNIVNVGSVCRLFYILLLTSFEEIIIHCNNVSSVSRLALKNTKKVAFSGVKKRLVYEIFQELHELKPKYLQKLEVIGIGKHHSKTVSDAIENYHKTLKKKQDSVLLRITDLKCNSHHMKFPKYLHNLKTIGLLKGVYDKKRRQKITTINFSCFDFFITHVTSKSNNSPMKILNLRYPNLKILSIKSKNLSLSSLNSFEKLQSIFKFNDYIEELQILITSEVTHTKKYRFSGRHNEGVKIFDILPTNMKLNRQKFIIKNHCERISETDLQKARNKRSNRSSYSLEVVYPTTENTFEIHELNIYSCIKKDFFWECLDFNLVEIIDSEFFEINKINIFRGEISVIPRKWKISLDESKESVLRKSKKIISSLRSFVYFFGEYVVNNNFEVFELRIVGRDKLYLSSCESVLFKYEKKHNRVRIRYSTELVESTEFSLQQINDHFTSFNNNIQLDENILSKRPCFVATYLFINNELENILENADLDTVEFGFDGINRSQELEWVDLFEKKKNNRFSFDNDGFCFSSKNSF